MKKLGILFLTAFWSISLHANTTQFVSDNLTTTLHSGNSKGYRIIRFIPSGTKMEVLETTEDGWSKVRTPKGTEGWVESKFLQNQPGAKDRLTSAQKKIDRLSDENKRLQQELSALQGASNSQANEISRSTKEYEKINTEIKRLRKVAAEPVRLSEENAKLKEEAITMKNELRLFQGKNQVLQDNSNKMWFAVGASVLFGGMLLGLIIPKIRWRKKSSWSEL
jgi:SH3 domain protein